LGWSLGFETLLARNCAARGLSTPQNLFKASGDDGLGMARTHSAASLKPRDCLTRTTQVSAKDAHDQPLPAGDAL